MGQKKSMVNVVNIDLSSNKIKVLTPEFCANLPGLKNLVIDMNLVEIIPRDILLLKKLELFSFVGNRVKYLPKYLLELENLKALRNEWPFIVSNQKNLASFEDFLDIEKTHFNLDRIRIQHHLYLNPQAESISFVEYVDCLCNRHLIQPGA